MLFLRESFLRKSLAASLIVILSSCTALAQGGLFDWKNVEKLKAGTQVVVKTERGQEINGMVLAVTDDTLFVEVALPFGDWRRVGLSRAEIIEIRNKRSRGVQALIGAGIGLGVGIGVGAAYDARHPYSDDPGLGKLIFGILGTAIGLGAGSAFPTKGKKIYAAP
jgi:hypothetical protein